MAKTRTGWLVGVDVGGTFTDFFARRLEDGATQVYKRPSTPHNPGEAIVRGLQEMAAALDVDPARIGRLCHGTTVATNALISAARRRRRPGDHRRLPRPAGDRPPDPAAHVFAAAGSPGTPWWPRRRRFEVRERLGPAGEVLTALDEAGLAKVAEAVAASGAQSCPPSAACSPSSIPRTNGASPKP